MSGRIESCEPRGEGRERGRRERECAAGLDAARASAGGQITEGEGETARHRHRPRLSRSRAREDRYMCWRRGPAEVVERGRGETGNVRDQTGARPTGGRGGSRRRRGAPSRETWATDEEGRKMKLL